MTSVLVAYATKMGSTKGIAEAIGATIAEAGFEVTVLPARDVRDVKPYDAVVLGSALYAMRWRPDAVRFLKRYQGELARLWLFHNGPIGPDAAKPQRTPKKVRQLAGQDAVTFGGRIEADTAKGFIARKMAQGPSAGDFRDWDQIHAWATEIARALHKDDTHAPQDH